MDAKLLLRDCIADVRRLRLEKPDYDSVQVLLARTKTSNALIDIYGANSALYQVKLFRTFMQAEFERNGMSKQEAFVASLPIVEKGLMTLCEDLL